MKFILFTSSIIILFSSCDSKFTSKKQARNLINEQGFRTGRWVDFFDSSGVKTIDTSNYSYYILSEYENGIPVNNFTGYYKSNNLKSIGKFSRLNSNNKYLSRESFPKFYEGLQIEYLNSSVKRMRFQTIYNDTGLLQKAIFYLKGKNQQDDSLILEVNRYSRSNFLKEEILTLGSEKHRMHLIYDSVPYIDQDRFRSFYKKIKKVYESKWQEASENAKDELSIEYNNYLKTRLTDVVLLSFLNNLYEDDELNISSSTKTVDKNITYDSFTNKYYKRSTPWSVKNQMKELYRRYQFSDQQNVSQSNKFVYCRYCGNVFNKYNGYVVAAGDRYGRRYFIVELADKLTKGAVSIGGASFYCSERCLRLSGYSPN